MNRTEDNQPNLQMAIRQTLALVLAGGKGSRLMGLTEDNAKPAVPFGGQYRIIDFPLSNCINSSIRKIAVLTQYRAHKLIQHVQRGWGFLKSELNEFVEIWPAQQQTKKERWYQGTADAVYQNINTIEAYGTRYILILAGDHVYKQDYSKMLAQHIEKEADVTVSCVDVPIKDARGFGVVKVDENDAVISFVEKSKNPPCAPGHPELAFASMGIYIFNVDFLIRHLLLDAVSEISTHDFGTDMLPYLVGKCRLYAHHFSTSCIMNPAVRVPYWRDIGTLDAYWKANMDLTMITPSLDLYDTNWPIWTYQEQHPAGKFIFDDEERRGMAVDSLVSSGCIVSGSVVRRSLLYNNVRVNSYCQIEDTVILPNCDIGRNSIIKKAIISSDCVIPEGFTVGLDLEHDAGRFYMTEEGIALVTKEIYLSPSKVVGATHLSMIS